MVAAVHAISFAVLSESDSEKIDHSPRKGQKRPCPSDSDPITPAKSAPEALLDSVGAGLLTTPCKTVAEFAPNGSKAVVGQVCTPPKQRGRPPGSAQCYGGSSLAKREYRGVRGGRSSNKRFPGQTALQHLPSPQTLEEVVKASRDLLKVNQKGHFTRGSLKAVKLRFPEMHLADSTIRRCHMHGREILQQARENRSLRQAGRFDTTSGPGRFREGLRRKGKQGRPQECSAVIYEVGSWHEEQRMQQLWVDDDELALEFEERLEAHCKVLHKLNKAEGLPPCLLKEMEFMQRRLGQMKSVGLRRQALKRLKTALGVVRYAVQKMTDLTPQEQQLRMLRYWQHLDWMYHIIKSRNAAVLRQYVHDPLAFVRAADDTVIFLFDEVPKWVALIGKKILVTAAEAAEKRDSAAARARDKRQGAKQGCSGRQVRDHVKEIVDGPAGGNGADKFRITTIMLQFLYHWFNDKDPVGEVGPTVCIFFGATARLENIDEHGVDKTTGQRVHPALMQEWRELRQQKRLEGLGSELLVWQQANAYADDDIMRWMYQWVCQLVAPRPVMGIVDAASCHWSEASKKVAFEMNAPLVQIPRGMTMPAQLTDAEMTVAKAATEPRCRAQIAREKKQLGEPLRFRKIDMYRLCLAQHRYSVKLNDETRVIVLGGRRIGMLSRRPQSDGSMQNVDDDVWAAVGQNGRSGSEGSPGHWSIDKHGHAVTTGSTRMKPEWVAQRHSLPLERPIYNQDDLDIDYGEAPCDDPSSAVADMDDLRVDENFVGEALVQKRIEHAARTLSSTMMTDLAQRKEYRERGYEDQGIPTGS